MKVGSLFSGIGGLDLGLERAGMRVVWQSEVDPYCCRVLAKHWPHVPNLGDVTTIDWSTVERVDLICGGFPCQPVSLAGQRRGQDDERWLWPEFARAIRDLRPRHVLVENVPGLLVRGMGDVLGELATLGYDAEWESIPAAAVGAPHLRYRVFIVARLHEPSGTIPDALSGELRVERERDGEQRRVEGPAVARVDGASQPVADADGGGREGVGLAEPAGVEGPRGCLTDGRGSLRQLGDIAGAGWWATEPDVGRVAHGVPSRVDRLRALGNAVVPQVAEWVGRRILEAAA